MISIVTFNRTEMIIRRVAFLLLLVFTSGCLDLKWGSDWEVRKTEEWKNAKKDSTKGKFKSTNSYRVDLINDQVYRSIAAKQNKALSVYISSMCNSIPMKVRIFKNRGTQLSAFLYLPFFYYKNNPPDFLRIHINYPNSKTMCMNAAKDLFKVSVNRTPTDDFFIQPGGIYLPDNPTSNETCYIDIALITPEKDRVELKIDEKVFGCKAVELDFERKSYFCIKATEFGGSGYCGD